MTGNYHLGMSVCVQNGACCHGGAWQEKGSPEEGEAWYSFGLCGSLVFIHSYTHLISSGLSLQQLEAGFWFLARD